MIGILTYDHPHRKTQDLISKLLIKGYKELIIIATPFYERKKFIPLYQHRPTHCVNIGLDELCKNLNLKLVKCEISYLADCLTSLNLENILIGGAGILPEEIAKNFKIINSHPGYLPIVKGLDALKWAIYYNQPIGVTTHFISKTTDEGILIDRKLVPIYFEDTFHSIAFRQYEMEIDMLVEAIEISKNLKEIIELTDDNFKANKRMPHHLENIMMKKFEQRVQNSPSFREIELKNED